MSMIMYLLRVTPEQISSLRADPTLLTGVCHIASHLEFGDRTQDQILAELTAQRDKLAPDFVGTAHDWVSPLEASVKRAADLNLDGAFCLQKEWHMLHFFLNGTGDIVEGPGGMLFAGDEIGEDHGYGPARIVEPHAVSAFADIVAPLTVSDLQSRVDIPAMENQQIYAAPFSDDDSEPDELNQAISIYFPRFKNYLDAAQSRGDGLLIWIS